MLETLERRSDRPRPRRRRSLVVLLVLVLLLVGAAVAVGGYYQWAVGASGPKSPILLVIPTGATGTEVANLLKEEGVIRSTLAFRVMARFRGFSSGFEAGKYHLHTNLTMSEALAELKRGPFVESTRATFAEGLTVAQTAARAHRQLPEVSAPAFVKAARSGRYSLEPYLPKGTKTVEGFLFPSTYDFLKDADADAVIKRLLDQFSAEARTLPWQNAKALKVTDYQVVVVASMIEREARFDEDRPKIAAVIYNRLKKGMPLQIDATVLYSLGRTKGSLTTEDLKVDSPYNTYAHTGLPPTPIASPGLASLRAALNPAKADYLYYVVIDAAGHHGFTASYAEFLRLKAGSKG
jgi:UPF0755 protein